MARWADRLNELLVGNRFLLATSLFEIVSAEGFDGSYPTVARWVRDQRGPRFRRADQASVPIETAPGEEAQFDFSDCSAWAQRVGFGDVLWCFGMILCWSRWRLWWFTTSVDREHTFEGLVRFFEAAGGVPQAVPHRPDGSVGHVAGPAVQAAPADVGVRPLSRHRDQGLSGRRRETQRQDRAPVPRPRRELPRRARRHRRADRPSTSSTTAPSGGSTGGSTTGRTARTGAGPIDRFATEHGFLQALPRRRFDTDYVEVRRVHRVLPLIEWRGVRYSVPTDCLGQLVEARQAVDADRLEVRCAGRVVATHRIATATPARCGTRPTGSSAESAALASTRRRHLHVVGDQRRRTPGGWCCPAVTSTSPHPICARYDTGTFMSGRLRADQGRSRLPAARPGRRGVRHARRTSPQRRLVPHRVPRPARRRTGSGDTEPAARRPAALRPVPVPPARSPSSTSSSSRPSTAASSTTSPRCGS